MKKFAAVLMMMIFFCMPFTSLAAGDVYSTSSADVFTNGDTTLPYRIILPEDYDEENSYPLLLFLHGAGERGTDNLTQLQNCVQIIANNASDAIIVAPQCSVENQWVDTPWEMGTYSVNEVPESNELAAVVALISELQTTYSVDTDRIYASGISMGAFGVWDLMVRHNDIFAAGIAVCGSGDPSQAEILKDTPMFVFHGDVDITVPVTGSRDTVNAIMEAGGEKVKYLEYPGGQHNIWDAAFETSGLFEELFECRLSDRYPTEETEATDTLAIAEETNEAADTSNGLSSIQIIAIAAAVVIVVAVIVFVVIKRKNK